MLRAEPQQFQLDPDSKLGFHHPQKRQTDGEAALTVRTSRLRAHAGVMFELAAAAFTLST